MQPAARRTAYLAGLVLAAFVALGGLNRSRNEWVARCEAEGLSRAEVEDARAASDRAHEEEMNAMSRRVALLESDLARERELRSGAEAKAAAVAKPVADLEALKGELSRAHGRIGELERGLAPPDPEEVQDKLTKIERRAAVLTLVAESGEGKSKIRCRVEDAPAEGDLKVCKLIEVIRKVDDGRQTFDGGLNQGVDFVAKDEALPDPETRNALNQGVGYVEPPATQEGTEREVAIDEDPRLDESIGKRHEK